MSEHEDEITEQQVADAQAEHEPEVRPDSEPEYEPAPEAEHAEHEPDAEVESSARIEEIGKKLDGVNKYVARKMGEILGEDAQLFELCEICTFSNTPGWRPSGPLPPEVAAAVLQALGQRAQNELVSDPYSKPCETCKGEGALASWSRSPSAAPLSCPDCDSKGWIATDPKRQGGLGSTLNGPSPATPAEHPEPQPDPSEWDGLTVAEIKAKGGVVIPPYVGTV